MRPCLSQGDRVFALSVSLPHVYEMVRALFADWSDGNGRPFTSYSFFSRELAYRCARRFDGVVGDQCRAVGRAVVGQLFPFGLPSPLGLTAVDFG